MSARKPRSHRRAGFALVEVILALVVLPLAALLVYQGLGQPLRYTVEGVFYGVRSASVQTQMESIVRRYKRDMAAGGFSLANFKTAIEADANLTALYAATFMQESGSALQASGGTTNFLRVELRDTTHGLVAIFAQ